VAGPHASGWVADESFQGRGVNWRCEWSRDPGATKIEVIVIFRANVRNGHVVLDGPTDLPEGAKVEPLVLDAAAEMDATERSELEEFLPHVSQFGAGQPEG
jgi:hypothetical protein